MQLARTIFEISRAAEYFSARELQAQTGQPLDNFATVILKELVDNALDACETAGVAPKIGIGYMISSNKIRITVEDNGNGLQPDIIKRILNFNTRTSDKAAYRAPTRGAQGNALKTIIGIPYALGSSEAVIIESCGVRHKISAGVNPAGDVDINHNETTAIVKNGTIITVTIPAKIRNSVPIIGRKPIQYLILTL